MTPADLVKNLQGYYGLKYTEVEQPVIASWLKAEYARHGAGHLDNVWNQVTTDVSKNFGKLPDKALLDAAARKVRPATDPAHLPFPSLPEPEVDEQEMYAAELDLRATFARLGSPLSDERIAQFGQKVESQSTSKSSGSLQKALGVRLGGVSGIRTPGEGAPSQQNESSEGEGHA